MIQNTDSENINKKGSTEMFSAFIHQQNMLTNIQVET